MIRTLYTKLSHHPVFELIGILTLKPTNVVLLIPEGLHHAYDINQLIRYIKQRSDVTILTQNITLSDTLQIDALMHNFNKNDAMLLSALESIDEVQLFQRLTEQSHQVYFIEPDGDLWSLQNNQTTYIEPVAIELEDYFQAIGGRILHDERQFYVHELYDVILNWIRTHYDIWTHVKGILRNPTLTKSLPETPVISIQNTLKDTEDQAALSQWLSFLKSEGIVQVKYTPVKSLIRFKHHHFKEYFMKFGMWFEHMVYDLIKNTHILSSVNTGVLFSWDTAQNLVKNELDVVGLSDNRLVIISCKDTYNINEHSLNEIAVYTEGLAEDAAIKILASTYPLDQMHLRARAESLNVHLLVFNGDEKAFAQDLDNLLKAH